MWMFKNPQDYSVLVAENMFGDIVSDLCAGLVGGLGFAPVGEPRRQVRGLRTDARLRPEVRRPVQGQPDRDAADRQDDVRLAEGKSKATRLENAIARVIKEGKVRTYDMGGKDTTLEVAQGSRQVRQFLSWRETRPDSFWRLLRRRMPVALTGKGRRFGAPAAFPIAR